MKHKRNILSITLLILIASITFAYAEHDPHSPAHWYDIACCSLNDCHPIACEGITEKGKSLVYKGYEFFNSMIRPSHDGQCHVCISNEFSKDLDYTPLPHCIYIQQGS